MTKVFPRGCVFVYVGACVFACVFLICLLHVFHKFSTWQELNKNNVKLLITAYLLFFSGVTLNTGPLRSSFIENTIYYQAVTLEGVIRMFTGVFIPKKLISPNFKIFENILEIVLKRTVRVMKEIKLKLSCHIIICLNQLL